MREHYPTSPKARRRSNQYFILLRFESGEEPSSLLFLRPRRVEKETRVQKSLCRRIETLHQCLPVVLEPAEPLSMMSFCTPSIKDWGFDWSTSQLPFVHKYYLILSQTIRVSANSRNEQKEGYLPRIFMSISSSPFRWILNSISPPPPTRGEIPSNSRRSLFFPYHLQIAKDSIQPSCCFWKPNNKSRGSPTKVKDLSKVILGFCLSRTTSLLSIGISPTSYIDLCGHLNPTIN
jgi:hypothetical protein